MTTKKGPEGGKKAAPKAQKKTGTTTKCKTRKKPSKAQVEAFVEREDPWKKLRSPYGGRLSQAECLKRIESIVNGRSSLICSVDREAFSAIAHPAGLTEGILQALWSAHESNADALAVEKDSALYICLARCGIGALSLRENDEFAARLVLLDIASNELTTCKGLGGRNCFLRSLCLRENRFVSLAGMLPMQHLVDLDISCNKLNALDLSFCASSLRVLRAEQCDLDSSALVAVQCCANLEHVDLSHNRLGDAAAIRSTVECFRKHLRYLRLEGNPIGALELEGVLTWLKQQCPCLTEVDGKTQTHDFSREPGIKDLNINSGNDSALVQDSASCSCIEGNPCAVPYNCKDWENRVEVARRARAELGYQTTK